MKRSQRILVTGAAGFIGSTLVDRLLAEGREVVGLDNLDPFYEPALKRENLAEASRSERFHLIEGDIRDAAAVEKCFSEGRFDAVVHLAALAGVRPSLARPVAYADVNVGGTSILLDAAVRHGHPVFVFASSSSVYGEREQGPFVETDRVDRPISPYAATKKACELLAHTFHHAHGLPVTAVRFFTAYGPRQRPDLSIRKFAERLTAGEPIPIYGDGSALRDFTYVDDVVDGLVRAVDRPLGYAVLNFGAGRQIRLLDMVRKLETLLGVEAVIDWEPAQTGDVPRTWADIGAAREALGYEPAVDFDEGLARFVRWLHARRGASGSGIVAGAAGRVGDT